MKAFIQNTITATKNNAQIGFLEIVIAVLAIFVLLMPIA